MPEFNQWIPFVAGLIGTSLGGAITWGVAKTRISQLETNQTKLEARLLSVEQNQNSNALAMTELRTIVTLRFEDMKASIAKITSYLERTDDLKP